MTWQEVPLGEVLELKRGYDLPERLRSGGEIPVISSSGVTGTHNEAKVKGPGVVTGRYGTIGEVFYIASNFWPLNTTLYVRDFKGNHRKYVSYLLKGLNFGAFSGKSAVPGLNRNHLHQEHVRIAPKSEQPKIAETLSSLDEKIELNRKQNRTLEAIAQALFKHWFVEFEFPNKNGQPYKSSSGAMQPSELGEIPVGWRPGTLKDVAECYDSKRVPLSSRQRATRKGSYPYYGATSVMDYVDDFIFDGTYLLMGEDGSVITEAGYPYLQYVWGKIWVNNHAHVLQGKYTYTTEMLYLFLSKSDIRHIVTGAVQLKINQANMFSLELVVPTDGMLSEFNKIIEPVFKRIRKNREQIDILAKLRDTLLPKLMSGELSVKEAEKAAEAVT